MNFVGLLFLLIAHFLIGRGIVHLFKLQLPLLETVCISIILSIPVMSFAPSILQLCGISITKSSVSVIISVMAVLCSVPLLINFKKPVFEKPRLPKLYEWPMLLALLFFIVISVWRAYYMPPYSRDMLTGPELIAEYTVREHTMVNSVFNVDLTTTNNHFKSPYATCMQIIYKLLVFEFGQTWISILFVSLTIWLYSLLHKRIHPLLATLLLLLFTTVPEMYAYTFMLLYDYSNMVIFFSGFYFLMQYLINDRTNYFAYSVMMFGLATYIRTESLILIAMLLPLLSVSLFLKKKPVTTILMRCGLLMASSATFYFICIHIFVARFIPIPMSIGHDINPNLSDLSVLSDRLSDMWSKLIFSDSGTEFYGNYFYIFMSILVMDVIWLRKYNRESVIALYGVVMIYFGMGFIGYLLPLADLYNTTKRGMFKALPMMLFYMANSGSLLRISELMTNWELGIRKEKVKPVAQAKPVAVKPQVKSRK